MDKIKAVKTAVRLPLSTKVTELPAYHPIVVSIFQRRGALQKAQKLIICSIFPLKVMIAVALFLPSAVYLAAVSNPQQND